LYGEDEAGQGKFIDEIAQILLDNAEIWGREFPTKGKPIFLGISQGGDICFTLAAKYADRFRLCIPIAGRLLIDQLNVHHGAGLIRIHHGKEDPIVPIEGVRKAVKTLLSAKLNAELREYKNTGHEVPEKMRVSIHNDINAAIEK
jgi:predicted esterase